MLAGHFKNAEAGFRDELGERACYGEECPLSLVEFVAGQTGGRGAIIAGLGPLFLGPFIDDDADVGGEQLTEL